MVGTVDYIAPEVFSKDGYTETVDWWSLGTILYEMLMGFPPFCGQDPTITCRKVMNFKKCFEIPEGANISSEALDLLFKLINDADTRLGKNGVEEIKVHPFFRNVDWKHIRKTKAPYIPRLKSDIDTSNFGKFDEISNWHEDYLKEYRQNNKRKERGKDFFWIGYTFKKPHNYENSKQIEEIFERLKKKKEAEGKRMFSAEKIDQSNLKVYSAINDRKQGAKIVNNQIGGLFLKKHKEQGLDDGIKNIDQFDKKIFKSLHETDHKQAFIVNRPSKGFVLKMDKNISKSKISSCGNKSIESYRI